MTIGGTGGRLRPRAGQPPEMPYKGKESEKNGFKVFFYSPAKYVVGR
jgi:hypothetical protein